MLPLRAMLMRSIAAADPQAPLAERIDEALRDVAMRILRDASFEEAHPGIGAELRAIRGKRAAYLAHEFFNRDWAPMHPDEVASMLSSAGLRFATLAAEGGERFRREYWVMGQPQRAEGGAAGESTLDATAMAMTDAVIERRRAGCRLLNARLLALALESPDPAWLASPVTGGGVEVGHTGLLLIEAHRRGLREPVALSRAVQETLSRLGQRLVRNGTVIVERDQSGAVLEEEARVMLGSGLPRLTALGALPLVA
jgi:hypothetical protein